MPAAPVLTEERYVAADGTVLPVTVWPADRSPPRAIILGLHGFGDYRDAFEEPAAIWAAAGYTTYAYDQRGFGASPTRGRWPGTDTLVDDALAMSLLLHQRHPGVPVYIAGESMGGAVAMAMSVGSGAGTTVPSLDAVSPSEAAGISARSVPGGSCTR